MGPTRRQPVGTPGWNDKAAVAILVVCARHLLAVESPPLTSDRLAQLVAGYTFPQLVALFAQSPDARVRDDAARLRRLVLAGQVVYHGSCTVSPSPSATPSCASTWPAPPPQRASTSSPRPGRDGGRAGPRPRIPSGPPGARAGLVRSV